MGSAPPPNAGIIGMDCMHGSLRICIAVKIHHDYRNTYKEKRVFGAGLHFRGLVHYPHGRYHGVMQADMVLER